jgi:hypothetical protein
MARAKLKWGKCPACEGSGLKVTGFKTQSITQCKKCVGVGRCIIKPPRKKKETLPIDPTPALREEQELRDHLEGLS